MACGTCKKSSSQKETNGGVETTTQTPFLKKIGVFIIALLVSIIALPFLFIVLVSGLYQGWVGGFDLSKIVERFKKEEKEIMGEDINPEDYELVGVDKIK